MKDLEWNTISTCCVDVSLNNRYLTGFYFTSLLSWTGKRFKSCIINLGDTLHRHNLRHQYSNEKQAHDAAFKMGEKWIAENKESLEKQLIPYKLVRSHDWLAKPGFQPIHAELWSFYHRDVHFRHSVREDIENFVKRRPDLPRAVIESASLAYLMEETSADILLGQQQSVAHLYPGKWHQCYFYLMQHENELPHILRGLGNCAFKRISPAKILDTSNMNIEENHFELSKTA